MGQIKVKKKKGKGMIKNTTIMGFASVYTFEK